MFEQDAQKKVVSIQFGLFSPEEIRRGSVVNVLHPETVENGIPKENGLIDLRMGTTERSFLCQTCNSSSFDCVGHYGHIELSKPMFHIGYLSKIKKTLECVCFYCSKIKSPKRSLTPGLDECWVALKSRTICEGEETLDGRTGCGNKQPVIKKDGLALIAFMKEDDEGEGRVVLNGERVYSILKKIEEEDMHFLGFNSDNCRPEWMILTAIIVPPPSVRPSIVLNGHLRAEDDITHKLADIVKANSYLKKYEQEGAPSHIVRDYEQLLQFHLATMIDNDIGGQPQALQKNGRPLKSISARLKGKEGRIRGNLMGKRVDFSARSVISPDPAISVGEVGVPIHIAKIQTFPEKVNSFNIEYLQRLVNRGPNEHPGANYVIRSDGQRIDLNFNRIDLKLEKGFIVERHMQNNDEVLFNRQPSLHKMSMMGHRARIMPGKSFRLNLSATTPYNADFDGDEMNLHMPQSYPSKAELDILVAVDKQIVSPQSNKPVIGIIQDTLVGARLFTVRDAFFKRHEAMSLLYSIDAFAKTSEDFSDYLKPAILQPIELWTGKQLFTAILPRIFYSRASNMDTPAQEGRDWDNINLTDSKVIIQNGVLFAGSIDKRSAGAQQGGLIHIIFNDFGSEKAKQFIDNIQRLINYFLLHISSFSVGIGDCIADTNTYTLCKTTVQKAMSEVDEIISLTKRNELEKMPGMTLSETFESKVNVVLNRARNVSGSSAQTSLNTQNSMKAMVVSGSKGNYINISQITTCLGQQNVEGRRIPFGFLDRSLPHFYKYDFGARSKGFVQSSYLSGMFPDEFFFHAMGGREGIIDTAIKTAETGYIQRRLVKALEDATIQHDFSVRNGNGDVYQFAYGDDGFDATHLENVTVPMDNFKRRFFIDMFGEDTYAIQPSEVSPDVYQLMRDDVNLQKRLDREYDYLYANQGLLSAPYPSPVNVSRILKKHTQSRRSLHSISPYAILNALDGLMTGNKKLDYYLRISLNVKCVLLNISPDQFIIMLEEIKTRIMKARINANEMVGTIAAQSVGEPATQMTLNTFHLAGVASTVSMGVPRLNEIINLARTIKTPSMQIFLKNGLGHSIEDARKVQNQVEYLSLKMVCESSQILFDPDVRTTLIDEDREFVETYFEMPDEDINFDLLGKFVIRLVLSRSILVSRGLSLDFISARIRQVFGSTVHLVVSDENDERPVVRIRFLSSSNDSLSLLADAQATILKIHLQGYKQIKKAYLTNLNKLDKSEWCLQTDGIDFLPILSAPDIDGVRVVANDIYTICSALGIEAARQAILNELEFVIENNGSYVNHRHMSLLADVMTVKGYLTGITRHGVSRASASALKRASFEETVDVLLDAAASSEKDAVCGVSENIMLGQVPPVGTGCIDIILDTKKLDHIVPHRHVDPRGVMDMSPLHSPFSESVLGAWSSGDYSPIGMGGFSPLGSPSAGFSPDISSYSSAASPRYSPTSVPYTVRSPTYLQTSQAYNPLASSAYSPSSHVYSQGISYGYSPTSPSTTQKSPSYSPITPSYSPVTPTYDSNNSGYRPASPTYSPQSPSFEKKKKKDKDQDK
ncbi:DNA-directed RNA polymerase II core subunit rpo21 [Glugoides intestinalis]